MMDRMLHRTAREDRDVTSDAVKNVEVSWRPPVAAFVVLMVSVCLFSPAGGNGQAAFEVWVSQKVYHVKEHSNLTLLVSYSITTHPGSLYFHLMKVLGMNICLYDNESKEEPRVHEHYRGRLTSDWGLASVGQIQFSISNLTLDDGGRYSIVVNVGERTNSTHFDVVVNPVTRTSEDEEPGSRGRIGLYLSIGLFLIMLSGLVCFSFCN